MSEVSGFTLNFENEDNKLMLTNKYSGAEADIWTKEEIDKSSFKLKHIRVIITKEQQNYVMVFNF